MLQVRFAEVNRNAVQRTRRLVLHGRERLQRASAAGDDAAVRGPASIDHRRQASTLQRPAEPVRLQHEVQHRRRHPRAPDQGELPEPGRAEPDCLQRPGGQLPGRGRVPRPGRPGLEQRRHDRVEGVRRPPEVHADHRRRPDPAEGGAGGQQPRFQQRHHAAGLPDSRADHAAGGDRGGTPRRPVVRHRGPAPQRHAGERVGHPVALEPSRSSATSSRASPTRSSRPS